GSPPSAAVLPAPASAGGQPAGTHTSAEYPTRHAAEGTCQPAHAPIRPARRSSTTSVRPCAASPEPAAHQQPAGAPTPPPGARRHENRDSREVKKPTGSITRRFRRVAYTCSGGGKNRRPLQGGDGRPLVAP